MEEDEGAKWLPPWLQSIFPHDTRLCCFCPRPGPSRGSGDGDGDDVDVDGHGHGHGALLRMVLHGTPSVSPCRRAVRTP
jgi:hypothetical protein